MYLNVNNSNGKPQVFGKVNGVSVICFSHVGHRYDQRIKRLQEVTDCNNLKYIKIRSNVVKAIEANFNKVVTKNGKVVRNVLKDTIRVKCKGQRFEIDIQLLVKSSLVTWSFEHPLEVVKGYEELLANGDLKVGKPVITIETIIASLKCADEVQTNNFKDADKIGVIGNFRLPNFEYRLSVDEFLYMTKDMMKKHIERTERAYEAIKEIEEIYA